MEVYIIAALLVLVSFGLKCLIGRRLTLYNFLFCLIEMPIDIMFLSIGSIAALIISNSPYYKNAFIFFNIQLFFSFFVFYMCREGINNFNLIYKLSKYINDNKKSKLFNLEKQKDIFKEIKEKKLFITLMIIGSYLLTIILFIIAISISLGKVVFI